MENMEYIYHEIDKGRSVSSLAKELGVSRAGLYVWHQKYQKQAGGSRVTLTNGRGTEKKIDMALVYKKLNEGQSLSSIARELGVSTKTIYRHAEKEER